MLHRNHELILHLVEHAKLRGIEHFGGAFAHTPAVRLGRLELRLESRRIARRKDHADAVAVAIHAGASLSRLHVNLLPLVRQRRDERLGPLVRQTARVGKPGSQLHHGFAFHERVLVGLELLLAIGAQQIRDLAARWDRSG